ncbi:hypothetical protein Tsubulata_031154 [Turnera subulata]|uniref:Endonuclease/exonuclease/phosphatase domain-containing protein n=1 Tax=Turnera subulata TaxID=218843 RepID=A0A9Q0GNM4_9ROSI|nr:hypothetical protein Tsubulata_031154 [Turnera subulata]
MTAPVRPRRQTQSRPISHHVTSTKETASMEGSRYAALRTDLDKDGGLEEPVESGIGPWVSAATNKNPKPRKPTNPTKNTSNRTKQDASPSNLVSQGPNTRRPLAEISNLNTYPQTPAQWVPKSPTSSTSIPHLQTSSISVLVTNQQDCSPPLQQSKIANNPRATHPTPTRHHTVVPGDSAPLNAVLSTEEATTIAEYGRRATPDSPASHSPLQRTRPKPLPPDLNQFEEDVSPGSSPPRKDTKWGLVLKKGTRHPFKRLGKRVSHGTAFEKEEGIITFTDEEMLCVDQASRAAKPQFPRSLKLYVQRYKPSIVVIVEPRISGRSADRVIRRLRFRRSHRIEARGFSGGIWILWREDLVSVQILACHAQFIHIKITDDRHSFLFTAVYGSPQAAPRRALWQNLGVLAPTIREPWLIAGDFNAILDAAESSNPRKSPSSSMRDFQDCLVAAGMLDLGYVGPQFTWHRGTLKKRLDRALGNPEWSTYFPHSQVYHLPFLHSDHRPLLIVPDTCTEHSRNPQRFLFKASWMIHEDYDRFVQQNWDGNQPWSKALENFYKRITMWNKTVFGSPATRKRRLLARLQGIQDYLDRKPSLFLSNLELELRCELDKVLAQEELEWFQRSRCQWLKWGDHACIQEISAIIGPNQNRGHDRLCWATSAKGIFTTKTAYESLEREHWPSPTKAWDLEHVEVPARYPSCATLPC